SRTHTHLLHSFPTRRSSDLGSCASLDGAENEVERQLDRAEWQPTQAAPGARYVGREVCAQCHPRETTAQKSTAMAHALARPAERSEEHTSELQSRFDLVCRL